MGVGGVGLSRFGGSESGAIVVVVVVVVAVVVVVFAVRAGCVGTGIGVNGDGG